MTTAQAAQQLGLVMVLGAGSSSMQSALDLTNSGFYVQLLDKGSTIGEVMA